MREMIPLSLPEVTAGDLESVLEVLSGTALSLGPRLPQFERAVADVAGTRFAVAVNSGTSALHLCVKAAGIGDGDEVLTTPFSFVASANCLLYERAIPRFVDIDIDTYNIDASLLDGEVNHRTRGIIPVHVFGRPCDMDAIGRVAERHDLTVIEDSCEAIGATHRGRKVGGFGQSGVFAFYPNKQITTGEGGAVVTDDESVARLCRSWRNQGRGDGAGWLQHERLGYNYRLSDINCALGSAQLSRIDQTLARRGEIARGYDELLGNIPEVVAPPPSDGSYEISWFVYVVRLRPEFSRPERDEILQSLRSKGIGCSNYFTPIHLQPFYREMFGYGLGDFPVTEHVSERTIALPFFNELSYGQMETVTAELARAILAVKSRARVYCAAAD